MISKLKHSRRKDRTARNSADQDLEDALPPPPLPPRTTDMFIPATVSSTSTAGTESTTVENVIITDSVFGDDGTTGTPTNALCHIFSFTSITENAFSENIGLAPPIPPRTNEMYMLEDHSSKRGTASILGSEDQTRDCFILVAQKGSDTESMLAQNEDIMAEVDIDVEYPEDTISETSCDIGFPPPIPRQNQDMFLVQSFNPRHHVHTTVQIAMVPNESYTKAPQITAM